MKIELETLVEQMIAKGILLEEAIKEFEKKFILNTLKRHEENVSKAAVALGIHRNTLSKRLQEYTTPPVPPHSASNGLPKKRKSNKPVANRRKK